MKRLMKRLGDFLTAVALAIALFGVGPSKGADTLLPNVPLIGSLTGYETLPVLAQDNTTLYRATVNQIAAKAAWNQWRGAWSAAANYVINDVVSSGGNSYIAISANINQLPPNATYWNLIAAAGGGMSSLTCGAGLSGGTITTSGTCAISAPISVALGGTGSTTAGGTALDNISGFSTAGLIQRVGTGSYTVVSLPLGVANGGLGLTGGTAGGIPCYTASTTMASSASLGQYYLLTGGGSSACPGQVASLGTTNTILHGNASGLPTFGSLVYADIASGALATSANVLANAASVVATPNAIWGAGAVTALTDAATIAVDMSTGINFSVTLGASRALGAPTNTKVGQSGVIRVSQDATGSRTLSYNSVYKWSSGTACVLSTAASKVDYLWYFVYSSTEIFLSCTLDVR
jgi:hypothetical protein